jgi:hypothetical protein
MISAGDQVETANQTSQYAGYLKPEAFKNLPVSNAVGNHDSGNALFTDHFQLPNATKVGSSATNYDWWYTYNNTLFMFIDANYRSEHSQGAIAGHKAVMQEAIDKNPEVKWKVVVFHQGPYTNASHDTNDGYGFRTTWTPMFDDLGIDVVLNGHDHSYTRAYQMYGDNPQKEQQWIDDNGNIVSDDTGKLYNKVLNPTGTAYFELNSGSSSKFYALKPEKYFVAKQVQTNTSNFSIVDVTDDSFTVTTYAADVKYTGADYSRVIDTYTIYKSDTPEQVTASIRANAVSDIKEPVEFTVSLRGARDAMTVALAFEVDGNKLDETAIEALNGFTSMPIAWTDLGEGLWKGDVTLVYGLGTGTGLPSDDMVDIAAFSYRAKALGDAFMRLTSVTVAKKGDGAFDASWMDSSIETAEAETSIEENVVFSIYDPNKDGSVDQLDLTVALYYCQYKQGDSEWETAKLCDFNEDGEINMLDLLAVFLNYTN